MTVLNTLNFVAFNPLQNNNPIAVRRRKLVAKIDQKIQLASDKLNGERVWLKHVLRLTMCNK